MIKTTFFKAIEAADTFYIDGVEVHYNGLLDWAGSAQPESIRLSTEDDDYFFLDRPIEISAETGVAMVMVSEASVDGYHDEGQALVEFRVSRPLNAADLQDHTTEGTPA